MTMHKGAVPVARGPNRRFGPKAVGSFVPRLARAAFERYGFASATLLTDWPVIVGSALAANTAPERIRWPRQPSQSEPDGDVGGRRGATLVLAVDPAHALNIQYASAQIIERINAYFGYRAISELRIEQRPRRAPSGAVASSPRQSPDETPREVLAVEDDRLRGALEQLAIGIRARQSTGR